MVDFREILIDTFKDPIEGWYNPAHDALIRKNYFNTTGERLPNFAKVERFDPKIVEPISNKGVGWYTKVNIPPSSKLINKAQYLVEKSKIKPFVEGAQSPAKAFLGKAVRTTPQAMILGLGMDMITDNMELERRKEESKKQIEGFRNFHTGPAYIGYPDTAEGRASRWAAEMLMGK